MTSPRPLPALDEDNRMFWTGGADGMLHIQRCDACQSFIHPPTGVCRHCLSDRVSDCPIEGRGTIESYTVNHQAWTPGMDVPFVIARIALSEVPGVILTSNVIGCDPGIVRIGQHVHVTFEENGEYHIPLFRLDADAT